MKVITILGSPKRNGKTAQALDMLENNLILQGHKVERIHVIDFNLTGCRGCNACFTSKNKANCVQKDDFMTIYNRMELADAIVYASPLYAWSFTAQMKSFVDRHFCLVTYPGLPEQSSVIEGKRVALLVTCSEPMENNADLIQIAFDRSFLRLKCLVAGKYIIDLSSAPDFEFRADKTTKSKVVEITK